MIMVHILLIIIKAHGLYTCDINTVTSLEAVVIVVLYLPRENKA